MNIQFMLLNLINTGYLIYNLFSWIFIPPVTGFPEWLSFTLIGTICAFYTFLVSGGITKYWGIIQIRGVKFSWIWVFCLFVVFNFFNASVSVPVRNLKICFRPGCKFGGGLLTNTTKIEPPQILMIPQWSN